MIHENLHTDADIIHLVSSQRRNGSGAPLIFENPKRDKEDLGTEIVFQETVKASRQHSVQI
jgi:hypothetical protein